jgi:DNA-binding response OmpR family regulator
MHVLLVEDEPLIRTMMVDVLTDAGFTVSEAADSATALAEFRQQKADLLFTDIRLPGAIDGWTLAEQLRSLDPALPVIYVSGHSNVRPRQISNSLFIQKPYSPAAVIRQMRTLLKQRDLPEGKP